MQYCTANQNLIVPIIQKSANVQDSEYEATRNNPVQHQAYVSIKCTLYLFMVLRSNEYCTNKFIIILFIVLINMFKLILIPCVCRIILCFDRYTIMLFPTRFIKAYKSMKINNLLFSKKIIKFLALCQSNPLKDESSKYTACNAYYRYLSIIIPLIWIHCVYVYI